MGLAGGQSCPEKGENGAWGIKHIQIPAYKQTLKGATSVLMAEQWPLRRDKLDQRKEKRNFSEGYMDAYFGKNRKNEKPRKFENNEKLKNNKNTENNENY